MVCTGTGLAIEPSGRKEKLHVTRNIKRPWGALHGYPTISGSKIYQNIMGFTAISGWSAPVHS